MYLNLDSCDPLPEAVTIAPDEAALIRYKKLHLVTSYHRGKFRFL